MVSNYTLASKFLHRMALGNINVAKLSFELEKALTPLNTNSIVEKPVFITGLARSGTTILMRSLYESNSFKSLTYSDMPFVLMPNLWKKFHVSTSGSQLQERAHKDGIMVNNESPESFEEVFWRVFYHKDYIQNNYLIKHQVSDEMIHQFRWFIKLVTKASKNEQPKRYLSKNNNNILRISAIQKAFPDAKIVIPFRNPLQHAFSLMNQHHHFIHAQTKDRFILNYMQWLGHFEFGNGHKPFLFDTKNITELKKYNKNHINYWLVIWNNYYSEILANTPKNAFLVQYEDICSEPLKIFNQLNFYLDTSIIPSENYFKPALTKNISDYDINLFHKSNEIFEQLQQKKIK